MKNFIRRLFVCRPRRPRFYKFPSGCVRGRLFPRIFRVLVFPCGLFVLWALLSLFILPFGELEDFRHRRCSTRIYDRGGNLVQILALENGMRREYVSLSDMPENLVHIFLTAEDKRFFSHGGVDVSSVLRAAVQNIQTRRIVSGASTLSMQLARLVHPSKQRGFFSKLSEAWNALRIERRLSKDEILELYLNNLPFGFQTEGVASAAKTFFASSLADLSAEQLCCLAVIPRRPAGYNPFDYPEECARKACELYRAAFCNENVFYEEDPADTEKRFVKAAQGARRFEYPFFLPHYTDFIKKKYLNSGHSSTAAPSGVFPAEIHLSADAALSSRAEFLLKTQLEHNRDSRIHNGAVLAIDNKTAEVIVWVGSQSYFDEEYQGSIDGVTALNQSGSSMKPFLYALALEKGAKPSDILGDLPFQFGSDEVYIPRNFNNRYNGPVRFRTALASSLNIPAVSLLDSIGEIAYLETLDKLKFKSIREKGLDAGLSLALGSVPVSLYEAVQAFSVFARDGKILPIRHFRNHAFDDVLGEEEAVYSPDTARLICSILSDKEARVKGFGFAPVFKTPFPSIFKTGTANQYQSLVALASSSEYTVGVWLGNFSGETVVGKTGSSVPAYIAREILTDLHSYALSCGTLKKAHPFREPEHWQKRRICALSGMEAGADCPHTVLEYMPLSDFQSNSDSQGSSGLRDGALGKTCSWHIRRGGICVTVYPQEYRHWFAKNERYGSVGADEGPLKIVKPLEGAHFIYDKGLTPVSMIPLEITGGTEDRAHIFYDGTLYAELESPFSLRLPVSPGTHIVEVYCGDEQTSVSFTVE